MTTPAEQPGKVAGEVVLRFPDLGIEGVVGSIELDVHTTTRRGLERQVTDRLRAGGE